MSDSTNIGLRCPGSQKHCFSLTVLPLSQHASTINSLIVANNLYPTERMFREIRLLFSTFSARFSVVYLYVHGLPGIWYLPGDGHAPCSGAGCSRTLRLSLLLSACATVGFGLSAGTLVPRDTVSTLLPPLRATSSAAVLI